mmetsp:Transcript_30720/g.60132  ORF Transcript_30720/g.60132 Transcript_30720/m.60132 type:complete len:399 (+) Transcript_30720:2-1198(+)
MSLKEAKAKCTEIFEEYIDIHKIKAFDSGFMQPICTYFGSPDVGYFINFENHGINSALAGILSTTGLQMVIIPYLNNTACGDFPTFWESKGMDEAWEKFFCKKEFFGRKMHAIPGLKDFRDKNMDKNTCKYTSNFYGVGFAPSKTFAQKLVDDSKVRPKWAKYIERLCYFLRRDFFCEEAISMLMQEDTSNPRLLGFRACMDVLFKHYKKQEQQTQKQHLQDKQPKEEPQQQDAGKTKRDADDVGFDAVLLSSTSFAEYIYDEDNSRYDLDRVNNLFWYAGITKNKVKPPARGQTNKTAVVTPNAAETPEGKTTNTATSITTRNVEKETGNPKTLTPNLASSYKGSEKLLKEVERMLSEGKSQREIFDGCTAGKLGSHKDIMKAVQVANFNKFNRKKQ